MPHSLHSGYCRLGRPFVTAMVWRGYRGYPFTNDPTTTPFFWFCPNVTFFCIRRIGLSDAECEHLVNGESGAKPVEYNAHHFADEIKKQINKPGPGIRIMELWDYDEMGVGAPDFLLLAWIGKDRGYFHLVFLFQDLKKCCVCFKSKKGLLKSLSPLRPEGVKPICGGTYFQFRFSIWQIPAIYYFGRFPQLRDEWDRPIFRCNFPHLGESGWCF